MAEITLPTQPPGTGTGTGTGTGAGAGAGRESSNLPGAQQQKRGPSIHQIYALPAPIRTFPLPTFYPNNAVSLFHVAYAWLGQVFRPPPAEPAIIHQGLWSEATTSVHITDEASVRALWEQGFYGKGSLSRSEPNWLKREQVRRGLQEAHVSEILTAQRREERAQAKWERARLEQEAIRQTRIEEAQQAEARRLARLAAMAASSPPPPPALLAPPIGPLELLALPNSAADLTAKSGPVSLSSGQWPVNGLGLIDQINGIPAPNDDERLKIDGAGPGNDESTSTDDQVEPRTPNGKAASSSDFAETKTLNCRKSVRFSPTVESATFKLSDPPSPGHSAAVKPSQPSPANGSSKVDDDDVSKSPLTASQGDVTSDAIINKEHLQLMPEEVFFLAFGLGVLAVTDAASGKKLSTKDLFALFRQHSYFPPRIGPDEPELEPDDAFLVHYAVYHHFRSLGWVPRAGIKFGVDWLLYARGPVFDHAEFGLIVIPSYSDPWWKAAGKRASQKTWPWLHCVVRVLSHVTKSLVLVYVDVPPPPKLEEALGVGVTEAMKLYKVREVMVKRWSSNRNR